MTASPDLTVIVFAFNEEENVGPVLGELVAWLRQRGVRSEIVVVDDGSTDHTREAAARSLEALGFPHSVVGHATNRGIGAALKTGVRASRGTWVTFMPADGQIEPAAVGTLLDARERDDADVVLSVYDHRDDGWDRTVLSAGVRALIWAVHGVRLESDGPYLFRRSLFDPEQLKPDTFFLNFEFPIRALAAGLTVSKVTIACRPRLAGHSKSTGLRRIAGVAKDLIDLRVRRTGDTVRHALGRRHR